MIIPRISKFLPLLSILIPNNKSIHKRSKISSDLWWSCTNTCFIKPINFLKLSKTSTLWMNTYSTYSEIWYRSSWKRRERILYKFKYCNLIEVFTHRAASTQIRFVQNTNLNYLKRDTHAQKHDIIYNDNSEFLGLC